MNLFISYSDMENKNPIQVIDLRHQYDHITSNKIRLFQDFFAGAGNVNARLFVKLIRQ